MRKFANINDITEGDVLIADCGFTCLENKQEVEVKEDKTGDLFVPCEQGQHFLSGQLNEKGDLIGFYRKFIKEEEPEEIFAD